MDYSGWCVGCFSIDNVGKSCSIKGMKPNSQSNTNNVPGSGKAQTVGGYLLSAIGMEEEISKSVYQDYMNPANWPRGADKKILAKIQAYLEILIDQTEEHRSRLIKLKRKLSE